MPKFGSSWVDKTDKGMQYKYYYHSNTERTLWARMNGGRWYDTPNIFFKRKGKWIRKRLYGE